MDFSGQGGDSTKMRRLEFEKLPFEERPDLTPYLVHLTRNTEKKDDCSAFDNLVKILKRGKIMGSGNAGYVKGPNKAACFMDVPLMALKYVLKKSVTTAPKPKYEPYGILVGKKYATEH